MWLQIDRVDLALPWSPRLAGFNIESPVRGTGGDTHSVLLEGWVVGRSEQPDGIEIWNRVAGPKRIPIAIPRPDVAAELHDPGAANSGFAAAVSLAGVPPAFELVVNALFRSGERVPLGTITGRRARWEAPKTRWQPVLVTTLGRTGSTWVSALLGQHPELVTYRPFEFDARTVTYWVEACQALAQPASYLSAVQPDLSADGWWSGAAQPSQAALKALEAPLDLWLGRETAAALFGFAQSRIAGFYDRVAALTEKSNATYFVEKVWPNAVPAVALELFPGGREIVLVRDFRDMVCSMVHYTPHPGYDGFGRGRIEDDVGFVRHIGTDVRQLSASWRARRETAFLLRYEDLVREPRSTAAHVCEHIGVASDDRTIDTVLADAASIPEEIQASHRTSGTAAASVGRWRRDLDPRLRDLCNDVFAEALEEFGYE
jgi:hypothetical protein